MVALTTPEQHATSSYHHALPLPEQKNHTSTSQPGVLLLFGNQACKFIHGCDMEAKVPVDRSKSETSSISLNTICAKFTQIDICGICLFERIFLLYFNTTISLSCSDIHAFGHGLTEREGLLVFNIEFSTVLAGLHALPLSHK
eukprot:1286274-Amphidinium_carterae.1